MIEKIKKWLNLLFKIFRKHKRKTADSDKVLVAGDFLKAPEQYCLTRNDFKKDVSKERKMAKHN